MGQNKITEFLLLLILIITAGISLLYGCNFWETNWKFKNEVELTDLINIVVTVFSAIGAAWFIAKKLSEDRFNKKLIINDLKKIEEQIGCIIEIFVKNDTLTNEQQQEILNINSYLNSLIVRFEIVHSPNSELRRIFNSFYRYSTDFGLENGIDLQQVIQEGNQLIKIIRLQISRVNKK